MVVKVKRVYDGVASDDGTRILVDRLWPRGVARKEAKVDLWLKEVAPSAELRTWFAHDPEKWEEFRRRYEAEIAENRQVLDQLCREVEKSDVTLLYAARDTAHNNAVALQHVLSDRKSSRKS